MLKGHLGKRLSVELNNGSPPRGKVVTVGEQWVRSGKIKDRAGHFNIIGTGQGDSL